MNLITKSTIDDVINKNLVCLRDAKTRKLLNVSFSEDGLKWTLSPQGKLIYFKHAYLRRIHNKEYNLVHVEIVGNNKNPNVIVEEFIPTNFSNPYMQAAEYAGIHKAYKLCYNIAENDQSIS